MLLPPLLVSFTENRMNDEHSPKQPVPETKKEPSYQEITDSLIRAEFTVLISSTAPDKLTSEKVHQEHLEDSSTAE